MANGRKGDLDVALRLQADVRNAIQGLARIDAELKRLSGTSNTTNRQQTLGAARVAAAAQGQAKAISGVRGELERLPALLTRIAGLVGVAFGAREIARATEAWTTITNRLRLVTKGSDELRAAQDAVFVSAQSARQPLDATAELYQRIATNAGELGLSGAAVAGVVDTINKTLAISGTSASSASAALTQLGQAFASGTLRGEELNSVLEQAPALAQSIAKGLGVSVGELRKLGEPGALSAGNVIQALQRQGDAVDKQFATIATTGGQAMTVLGNSLVRLVGTLNDATGAGSGFADVILGLSQWIDSGVLADGLLDAFSIWSDVFDAMRTDVQGLGLELGGLSAAGDETASFLARAFQQMPANVRAAIQIATVEVLALFDRAIAYAGYAARAITDLFLRGSQAAASAELERQLGQINAVREQSITTILAERDAILQGASAERERRQAERNALVASRKERERAIEALRKEAQQRGLTLGGKDKEGRGDAFLEKQQSLTTQLADAQNRLANARKGVNEADGRAIVGLEAWLSTNQKALKLTDEQVAKLRELAGQGDATKRALQAAQDDQELRKRAIQGVQDVEIQWLEATGRAADASAKQIEARYAQLRADLQLAGEADALFKLEDVIDIEKAKAQLAELQAEAERIFSAKDRQEQSIQTQVTAGTMGEISARERINELYLQTADQVDALIPRMLELARATGNPELIAGVERIQLQTKTMRADVVDLGKVFDEAFKGKLGGALEALATRTASLRDAITDMLRGIAQEMAKFAAQNIAGAVAAGPQGGWMAAAKSIFGFAAGGYTGPGGKYQPAGIVHAGEFVHRQEVVRQPGALTFLSEFNRIGMRALAGWRGLGGYAGGGLVGLPSLASPSAGWQPAAPAAGGPTTVDARYRVLPVLDEDLIGDALKGPKGEELFLLHISRNPSKFRSVLKI